MLQKYFYNGLGPVNGKTFASHGKWNLEANAMFLFYLRNGFIDFCLATTCFWRCLACDFVVVVVVVVFASTLQNECTSEWRLVQRLTYSEAILWYVGTRFGNSVMVHIFFSFISLHWHLEMDWALIHQTFWHFVWGTAFFDITLACRIFSHIKTLRSPFYIKTCESLFIEIRITLCLFAYIHI